MGCERECVCVCVRARVYISPLLTRWVCVGTVWCVCVRVCVCVARVRPRVCVCVCVCVYFTTSCPGVQDVT